MQLKIYLLILITVITTNALAQKQNIYYLKDDGKEVSTKDSADYVAIISEPDTGDTNFNLREYYTNGKVKFIGKTSRSNQKILEGQCLTFYPSGKKKQIATFKGNFPIDELYDYYPNGVLYRVINQIQLGSPNFQIDDVRPFIPLEALIDPKPNTSAGTGSSDKLVFFSVTTLQDSTGKLLLTNGNGQYVEYNPTFKEIMKDGFLKNNLKDSVWKGRAVANGSLFNFIETYRNGKFISGKSTDPNGVIYSYDKLNINAEYVGGDTEFNRYLAANLKYPHEAKDRNIQGRVFIQFVIDTDGLPIDFKTLRDPGGGLGDEAIRVIKSMPRWIPGRINGMPIKVQYTVPVNFSLGIDIQVKGNNNTNNNGSSFRVINRPNNNR